MLEVLKSNREFLILKDSVFRDYGTVPEVNPSNPLHWTFDTATTHSDCCTATTSRESTSSRNSSSRPLNQPHSSHPHQHQPQYPHQSLNQALPPQPIHRQPVLNQRSNSVASTSSTTVIPDRAHTSNCATSSAIAATPITACHRQPASAIGLSGITDSVVISDSSNISAVSQPSLSVPSERCPLANTSASTSHLLNVNKSTSRTLPLFESTASSPSTSVLPQKSLKTTSASALRSLPSQLSKAEIKQTPFAESAVQFTIPPHLPLSSDDDALAYSMGSQHMAPLATPEHIEIASDYMTVKDALGCGEEDTEEEDCAYATLDFSSCSSNATPIGDINTNLTTAPSSKTTSTRRSPTVTNHAKNLIAHLPKRHPTTAAPTATASSSPAAQSPQSKTSANLQSASVSSSSSASLNQPSSSTGDIASSVLPVSHHQQNSRHDCDGKTNDSHKGVTQIATQSIIISASVPSTNLTAAKQHRRADKSPLARQPQINVEAHAANDNAAISVRTNRVPNMAALNPQTEAPKSKRLQLQRQKAPPLIKTKLVPQTAGRGSAIPAIHRLHSISAESLVDVGLINSTNLYGHISRAGDEFASTDAGSPSSAKKFSKNRFVRKMASSFRFRRGTPHAVNTNGNNDNDGSCLNASSPSRQSTKVKKILLDDGMIIVDVNDAASATSTENDEKLNDSDIGDSDSRSVPHSPHSERRHHHASVLFNRRREPPSSSEKISNAFSWLPSRSPKRSAARNVTLESTTAYRLNGVVSTSDTLNSLAASSPDSVPFFVKKCIEYIEKVGGLETEGLYRVPGNQAQVIDLERAFVADNSIDLECLSLPVHVVATALKNFLSALPEPLIPYDMHDKLVSLLDVAQDEASNRIRETLESWPLANHNTTIYLLEHLARVASHSDINSMDIRNLSKVWWPTLFRPNFDSFQSMAVFVTRLELATQLLIRASSDQQQQQQ
ncbi:unnamed protein product [Anisakis simplex]|uniref:Rho GTPase-activating protein 190 (inferred by orthology to a D. melanogaster protein) n=1 Tax=Anisakis simplex TaxID=6269 RepID=A0A0M3K3S1_ANISI|nr:unnamed protein product [Anisakis simplex]